MLAEKVGIDGYDIRERNGVLRPGEAFATGQIMRESCGILQTATGGQRYIQDR